jgi:hypothetical protein
MQLADGAEMAGDVRISRPATLKAARTEFACIANLLLEQQLTLAG